MTLIEKFNIANVKKILIIDDDLSKTITLRDLEQYAGNSAADALQDTDDVNYEEMIELLKQYGMPFDTTNDIVASLSREDIVTKSPELIKSGVNNIFSRRGDAAVGVMEVKGWLIDEGFDVNDIDIISNPSELDDSKSYDLILVDYYLDGYSVDLSIEFIKQILAKNKAQDTVQLFILMSSHEAELRDRFNELRPEFGATGSRFRILKKPHPDSAEDKLSWMSTLKQLADERNLVEPIETFISAWSAKLKESVEKLSDGLWGLDAYSLNVLRQTAEKDHAYFDEYMAILFSRHILAIVEKDKYPADETKKLEDKLLNAPLLKQGSEISDSREALRRLLGDIGWHREHWFLADSYYPEVDVSKTYCEEDSYLRDLYRFDWFMKNIRFGTVMKHKKIHDNLIVQLTQSCDKAHVSCSDYAENHLLLFPGNFASIEATTETNQRGISGYYHDGDIWGNIHWHLKKPRTPTIKEFLVDLEDYEIVGQLRSDQAQSIVNQYASITSRVASMNVPLFNRLSGNLIKDIDGTGVQWCFSADKLIEGHLYKKDASTNVISFEPKEIMKIMSEVLDDLSERFDLQENLLSVETDKTYKLIEDDSLAIYITETPPDLKSAPDGSNGVGGQAMKFAKKNSVLVLWRNN